MDNRNMSDWLFVAIEEYKALRMEILNSIKLQYLTVQIGLTAIGVLLVLLSTFLNKKYLPQIFLLILTPAASYITLFLWMGEVERMVRAGIYIHSREKYMSTLFKGMPSPLNWETWLREPVSNGVDRHIAANYKSVIALYLGAAVTSILIGNTNYFKAKIPLKWLFTIDFIEAIVFVGMLIYYYRKATRIRDFKIA